MVTISEARQAFCSGRTLFMMLRSLPKYPIYQLQHTVHIAPLLRQIITMTSPVLTGKKSKEQMVTPHVIQRGMSSKAVPAITFMVSEEKLGRQTFTLDGW
jgi:hypothetical protein